MGRPKTSRAVEAEILSPVNGFVQGPEVHEKLSAAVVSSGVPEGAHEAQKMAASRLPLRLRLPLGVILSLVMSTVGELLLRSSAEPQQESSTMGDALLAASKVFELALIWFAKLDAYDSAALAVLSRGPTLYLLSAFYSIGPLTAGASLGFEVLSSFVAFFLVRPVSKAHSVVVTAQSYNGEIIADGALRVQTVLLAALIYHVTLFAAFRTFLPTTFVLYFEGIPTIRPALDTLAYGTVQMGALAVLFGLAARAFIFTPYASQMPTAADQEVAEFDPVGATVQQTLWYNLWGYTTRAKVVITRTGLVMAVVGLNIYLRCVMTIKGVEGFGAAAYASVWVIGALVTGIAFGAVGNV